MPKDKKKKSISIWSPGSISKAILCSIIAGVILATFHDLLDITNTSILELITSKVLLKFVISMFSAMLFYFIFYIIKMTPIVWFSDFSKMKGHLKFLGCEYCIVSIIMLLVLWIRQHINGVNFIVAETSISYNFILVPLVFIVFVFIYEYYKFFKLYEIDEASSESVAILQRSANVEGIIVFSFTTFMILLLK